MTSLNNTPIVVLECPCCGHQGIAVLEEKPVFDDENLLYPNFLGLSRYIDVKWNEVKKEETNE